MGLSSADDMLQWLFQKGKNHVIVFIKKKPLFVNIKTRILLN